MMKVLFSFIEEVKTNISCGKKLPYFVKQDVFMVTVVFPSFLLP